MDLKKCNSRVVCPKEKLEFIFLPWNVTGYLALYNHVSHGDKPNIGYIFNIRVRVHLSGIWYEQLNKQQ